MKKFVQRIVVIGGIGLSLAGCVSDADVDVASSHWYNPASWANNPSAADYAHSARKRVKQCQAQANDATGFQNERAKERNGQSCVDEMDLPAIMPAIAHEHSVTGGLY